MTSMRTIITTAAFAGIFLSSMPAFAVDEYNVSTGTTLTNAGVALRGDDAFEPAAARISGSRQGMNGKGASSR